MDFAIPAELQALCGTVRDFIEREVEPLADRIERDDQVPPGLLDGARQLGLFGMSVPEQFGGLGLSLVGRALLCQLLGRTSAGFASIISAHCGIGTGGSWNSGATP